MVAAIVGGVVAGLVVFAVAACLVLRISRHGHKKHDGGKADAVEVQQSSCPVRRNAASVKSDNSAVPAGAIASIDTPMMLPFNWRSLLCASWWLTWLQETVSTLQLCWYVTCFHDACASK
jgi:hypothetical protein